MTSEFLAADGPVHPLLQRYTAERYRFSIEWARIEPNWAFFSNAKLDHYKAVLEAFRRHGVGPGVAFLHGTTPRSFAEAGGGLNPESSELFPNYRSKAAKVLGGDMEFAFTINEPQVRQALS